MNSGTRNLIGSVSYELASDEACRTKAQHEAGPSPSKHARHKPSQGSAQAYRKAGPARAKATDAWAALRGLLLACVGSPCGCRVCVSLSSCEIPESARVSV